MPEISPRARRRRCPGLGSAACRPTTVASLVEEIDHHEAAVEDLLRGADGERLSIAEAGAITFTTHLVTRSERLRRFAHHPFFTDVGADLVGPDVNLYWDQAVYKKPEKPRRFPWHQDNGYAYVEPQRSSTRSAGSAWASRTTSWWPRWAPAARWSSPA